MGLFSRIWGGFAAIADAAFAVAGSLTSLSKSIDQVNVNLRQNLNLDGPAAAAPALEQQQTAEEQKKGRGSKSAA